MNKNFRLAIFIRVAIIVLLAEAIAFIVVVKPMFFVLAATTLLMVVVIINLIRYIEKTNKDLTHFLLSIRQGAFTESYTSGKRGLQFEQFSEALNEIVREFAKVNEQKELHYQFLQTLNESINVSILSFDEKGSLMMMNSAAKRLLDLPSFSKLEHFRKIDPALYDTVNTLEPELRTVVKVVIKQEQLQLSVQAKEIVINGKPVKIVLLHNINHELEVKEIEAWHQLIRVLTHEIMNSVTPIASLSSAAEELLKRQNKDVNEDVMEDVGQSLATIKSRSNGLIRFVTAYKEFSKPLNASLETFDVGAQLERVINLMQPQFDLMNVELEVELPQSTHYAVGDVALLDQVFINIIKNAIEAVAHDGTGKVRISMYMKNQKTVIAIADNGPGIDAETQSRMFVPFYTTKANGSGIGLSLSRQIMKLHNGTVKVQTSESGSVFVIEW